jgi:peptide-methionine (S)-S-oxide reductase
VPAVSGYTGGKTTNPSYSEVCSGTTGHAEAIQLTFDPKRISFEQILRIFFSIHDPTSLNRQGADVGTQYRSAVFYHNEEQKAVAEQVIHKLSAAKVWDAPIVTEVTPFHEFYAAEDYHQKYFKNNPEQSYCQMVIAPKLVKFRKQYLSREKIN